MPRKKYEKSVQRNLLYVELQYRALYISYMFCIFYKRIKCVCKMRFICSVKRNEYIEKDSFNFIRKTHIFAYVLNFFKMQNVSQPPYFNFNFRNFR